MHLYEIIRQPLLLPEANDLISRGMSPRLHNRLAWDANLGPWLLAIAPLLRVHVCMAPHLLIYAISERVLIELHLRIHCLLPR
jgi:hypothetical protein